MTPLIQRLDSTRRQAGFSVADMRRWLGLPWETVYAWIKGINNPMDHSVAQIEERLGWLEEELGKSDYFPVPLSVRFRERPAYVQSRLTEYEDRARAARPAAKQRRAAKRSAKK